MQDRSWGGLAILVAGALAILSVVHASDAVAEPQLPARTGAVVDAADIIRPNQEQGLAAKAEALRSQSNIELVVVTLPSLQGYSIERWGRALGNGWKVGGGSARGVLLIVAPNDRAVRIELGDGVPLSDSAAASIIDNIIVPQFRSGEMSGGILAGVDAIARAATGSPPQDRSIWQWPSLGNVNWSSAGLWLIIGVLVLLAVLQVIRDGGTLPPDYDRSQTSPSADPDDDEDEHVFGGRSRPRSSSSFSSRSSGWSSSRSSSGSRSSGGFGGRGASGRW